ncbi:MAG: hypothetical protein WCV92_01490 [Candidatus Buchananbacteria bacterium]
MTQRTKFKASVYILLLIIALILLFWFNSIMVAKARDYERLADLKVIQGKLTANFFKNNTYELPGCLNNSDLSSCSAGGDINFLGIADPLNSGEFKYIVYNLSESDFQLGFTLETKMGGLNPGGHIYGKEGVIK